MLSEDDYLRAVRRLLRPTNVPHVWITSYGEVHNVPDPSRYTAEQRAEIIEKLKEALGVGND